jgi:hypothetical protein
MSKIKIVGHASGSGVLTIAAPNTNTDRTITIPDVTGTLLDSGSDLPAANLTGTIADARFPATLPAASGANLTALPAANITGTLPAISATNLTNVPAANITGTLPAISGANLTGVNAVNAGRKNWIINGDFSIWQRYGVAGAAQPNSGYVADRWKGNNYTSGTYTFAQRTDATGQTFTTYGRLHQSVAGSTNARQCLDQYIEGTYLVGKTITVSFKARANAALAGCQVRGIFTSTQTFNLTTDWVKYSFTATAISSGSTARLMVDYGFNNAVWYADIAEFQVEVGSVATDFEKRPYAEELALCQRYFYLLNLDAVNAFYSAYLTRWMTEHVTFPVTMRATPSHSVKSGQVRYQYWQYGYESDSLTATSGAEINNQRVMFIFTATGSYSPANHGMHNNTNNMLINMDAEL